MTGLSDQVPHRDLNTADGRHHGGSALILVADHGTNDRLDVEWIASQHPAFDPFVGQILNSLFLPLERGLAHARQTRIRPQADEQIFRSPALAKNVSKPLFSRSPLCSGCLMAEPPGAGLYTPCLRRDSSPPTPRVNHGLVRSGTTGPPCLANPPAPPLRGDASLYPPFEFG